MSGIFPLDWAIMAVSLFNTILLLWLGLTVLLNAERRTWGIWLAGGGLLMGGAFFLCHTVILGLGPVFLSQSANLWWHLGWVPVIISPLAWYVVMLWYAGFWEDARTALHRRYRLWLWLLAAAGVGMVCMLFIANPLPSIFQIVQQNLVATPSLLGVPVLLLLYPPFILSCIGLSVDALLRPGPTMRMMGAQARHKARAWLATASIALLLVSLLVGAVMLYGILAARQTAFNDRINTIIAEIDLLVASLIAFAVVLTGQAVASYEVFTGKTLPRQGLLHYWRRALILAAGYSAAISLSLTLKTYPIYSLLLSTCLLALFYALLSWRSYGDRERFMAQLRPFVASQQLYEQMLASNAGSSALNVSQPFAALCEDVLGVRLAYLLPLGSMATLFGSPLSFPTGAAVPTTDLAAKLAIIPAQFSSPQTLCAPIDPQEYGGLIWSVPLWSERGLCGMLLLGEKKAGGLFVQEEIEIARSAGERLVDIQASAELARRLVVLQRQQLAESQLIDHRTRRVLHDDVLPQLHAALLTLSSPNPGPDGATPAGAGPDTLACLANVHHQIADLLRDLPAATAPEVTCLGLVSALQQLLQGELKLAFDQANLQAAPGVEENLPRIPPLAAEVLFYATREAMRNAARYARRPKSDIPLHLRLELAWKDGLEILVEDNGVGMGDTARQNGGSGHGLALHSTLLAVIGGSLAIESPPGASTRIRISLPVAQSL